MNELVETIGIGIVCYGSREVAMAEAFLSSAKYKVELYIADRLRNIFNAKHAKEHLVIPSLDIREIAAFFKRHRDEIDFGIVGPEDPIIHGIRDEVEKETGIPLICPTKEYALERSKVAQRRLLGEVVPYANPRYKVFDSRDYANENDVRAGLWAWLDEIDDRGVVKPDGAARGKGVGVWGDHFNTREQLFDHFMSIFRSGPVIVEEKIEGEESSYMAFCDGQHLARLPETRDHKRAFDQDQGPNTGGMGSYKNTDDWLPFMTKTDYQKEEQLIDRLFEHVRGKSRNTGLLGVPFYVAVMHTAKGPRILEINSRPGDPEILNILPIMKDDFVDVCYAILDGSLIRVQTENKATVATYKVPPTYGGREKEYTGDHHIDLRGANAAEHDRSLRLYPGSLELRNNEAYALSSRTVAAVGIGNSVEEARQRSLRGLGLIKGGNLWNRNDVASASSIQKSIQHMRALRATN